MSYVVPSYAMEVLLKAEATISAQVSTRIYALSLPSNFADVDSVPKSIVIQGAGGPVMKHSPIMEPVLDIKCYGPSPAAAWAVYNVVVNFLNSTSVSAYPKAITPSPNKLLSAHCGTVGNPQVEPDTGWVFILATCNTIMTNVVGS